VFYGCGVAAVRSILFE
jgi:hypothetical protein